MALGHVVNPPLISRFVNALKLTRYAIYVFDFGAPTGFRLALMAPDRITAIVSQNGNAYEEGLGDAWKRSSAIGMIQAPRIGTPFAPDSTSKVCATSIQWGFRTRPASDRRATH